MTRSFRVWAVAGLVGILLVRSLTGQADLRSRLTTALASEDEKAVYAVVAAARKQLGDKAGVPEVADEYLKVPKSAKWLTPAEARPLFARSLKQLDKLRWWKVGLDPTKLEHALREPAAVVAGCVAAHRAKLDGHEAFLRDAREAGDFLLWAQDKAGTGVFPFPAYRGPTKSAAFLAGQRYLSRAEKEGRLDKVVRDGWAFEDAGDGGLQFDNGECAVAMFDLYEATKEEKYLKSARRAADWAIGRPMVTNWNYNSFSVYLLARAFEVTGEKKYLAAATRKAVVGVIPGQLTDGPNAGRWLDGHNARPAYHYIMMRSLARLAAVMPKDDAERPKVMASLRRGLLARNREMVERGVMNKDHALQTLLVVYGRLSKEKELIAETKSAEALDALGRLASEQAIRGGSPLGPRAWGEFLEYVVTTPRR